MSTRTEKVVRSFEHEVGIHDVLQAMVQRHDVVSPAVIGEISRLERAVKNVISPIPTLRRHVRLNLDARALQVEVPSQLVEVPTITGPDVEDTSRATLDQVTVEPGPRSCPELDQDPGDTAVVCVVGVIVARIEGRKLRLLRAWREEFRLAIAALLYGEVAGRDDKIFEISDVGPIQPGPIRAADGTVDGGTGLDVGGLLDLAKR